MAVEVVMPKLAMAMKQGKVVEWKTGEGQWVEKGQIVMVIETEKVTYECESPAAGYLHIIAELDKAIPVNETVALLAENEAELAELQAAQPAPVEVAATAEPEPAVAAAAAPAAGPVKKGKVKITPAAKKLAKTHNFDFTKVTGSGPGGRIVKKDIISALESGLPEAAPPVEVERYEGKKVKKTVALRGMRQAIAEHMVHSLSVAAQLTLSGEIDMTEMIRNIFQFIFQNGQNILKWDWGDFVLQPGKLLGDLLGQYIYPGAKKLAQLDEHATHFHSQVAEAA